MPTHLLRVAFPSVLVCTLGLQCAYADVYAWVDGSGALVFSDLAPPQGVHVIEVVRDSAPTSAAQTNTPATRDVARPAEVEVLSARVRQLEREVELGRQAPVAAQYGVVPALGTNNGCDPWWSDCGSSWWGPAVYPGGIVVVGSPGFHGFARFHRGRHFAVLKPATVSGSVRVH